MCRWALDRGASWWRDGVVYQIYPRSFQDSDADGEGDLRGVISRLDHVADLGADAIWLSPFYPSPMADGGYDVAGYTDVDPRFGTLADAGLLIAAAHERDLKLLLDVVPCHTSIEHPWFREHPERYRLVRSRRAAEQLAGGVRRARLVARRAQRALVPALLLSRAARPELAPGGRAARRSPTSCASGSRAASTASGSTRSIA